MNHYTQLNLNSKKPSDSATKDSAQKKTSNRRTMMFGSLTLITALSGGVLLISNGCSKAKGSGKQANSVPISTPAQPTTPVPPASVSTQTAVLSKVAKKKRASVVTFHDRTYGVSFQYPRKYTLKNGGNAEDSTEAASMGFVQPGGVTVAIVEFPKGAYPGTDLSSAFFNVNVNRNLSSSECEQFASPEPGKPGLAPPAKVKVGQTEFSQIERMNAAENRETHYYHLFENSACYELALGLNVANVVSDNEITPVNRQSVFEKLDKILASVKIMPTDQGEVAAQTTQESSGEHQ
jgi:hypothetical protein